MSFFFPFLSFSLSVLLSGWLLGTQELYWLSVQTKEDQASLSLSLFPFLIAYAVILRVPLDPAGAGPQQYPDKTIVQKDACTPVFIAALFTIARTWKQPKCPSTNE